MGIFSLDNGFGQFMDKVWKLVILNFLCLICCLPIVTIGPAVTALYAMVFHMSKGKDSGIIKGYFVAFGKNAKKAFAIHGIMMVVAALLFVGVYYCRQLQAEYTFYKYWIYVICIIGCFCMAVCIYAYALLAEFENTIGGTLQNGVLFAITHIGPSLLMLIMIAVPVGICFISEDVMKWGIFFYLVCGGAVTAYLHAKILERVFVQYTEKPETDKQPE